MCEYFDYDVKKLKRVRIMNIKLDIPVGNYRDFTDKELNKINQLVEHSIKTYEAGN
jgi:23S rRNA pseudouridine2604 synthase